MKSSIEEEKVNKLLEEVLIRLKGYSYDSLPKSTQKLLHNISCIIVPERRTDPIVESVVNQFRKRSNVGVAKYGTTLEENKASLLEWLQHLQEELMDATLYVERLKKEIQ